MSNPARAYLTTQVETTTQGELLLMLYEAAIKFLKRAKIEIEKKDYAQKGIYISKAMAVISELAESLNKEKGGEITENLHSLYLFCNLHLAQANIRMDTGKVDEVIKILDGIRSAYAQVVPMVEKGASAAGVKRTSAAPAPAQKPAAPVKLTPKAAPTTQSAPVSPATTAEKEQEQPQQAPAASEQEVQAKEPETPKAPPAPEPQQPEAPKPMLNPTRLRATNAYSNSR